MKNLVSATARVSRDGGGENLLDDVRLFGGGRNSVAVLHSSVNFFM